MNSSLSQECNLVQRSNDRLGAQSIALSGLFGFLTAWITTDCLNISRPALLLLLFILMTAFPMILLNLFGNKTFLRSSSGLVASPRSINWNRGRIKFIGLAGTMAALTGIYCLIPEYSRAYYDPVWEVISWLALPTIMLAFPYIYWIDVRMADPEDGYWCAGLFILGRWKDIDCTRLSSYTLGWLVKGFFIPFMLAGGADLLRSLHVSGFHIATFGRLYASSLNVIYTIDVVFGAIGYLLTLRVLDSHIQSVEGTLLGWLSALCCYAPFSALLWPWFLNYHGKTNWTDWLAPHPVLLISWGFTIVVLHGIYVWATCSFGCRFSNLTNRGIITYGPYRYCKHPAYVSKNIAWWLMTVPFISHHTWPEALRACLCLLVTNLIYVVRALTEERHLLKDPAYQAYYSWVEKHGFLSQARACLEDIMTLRRRKEVYETPSS